MMIWTAIAMLLTMISAGRQIATLPAGTHRKRRLVLIVVCCGSVIVLAISLYSLATR